MAILKPHNTEGAIWTKLVFILKSETPTFIIKKKFSKNIDVDLFYSVFKNKLLNGPPYRMQNFMQRIVLCLENNDRHVEYIL